MIKVRSEVSVYEVNGKEQAGLSRPKIAIESHWNRDALVTICIGDESVTVVATDLLAAIKNACNSARY
jgi:hypothetical protein